MYDVALIGGAGYVGGAILDHFNAKGSRLLVIDNFVYKHSVTSASFVSKPNIDFVYLDFVNQLDKVIAKLKNCRSIVVLGGLVGDPITKKFPNFSESVNTIGIKKLLQTIDSQLEGKRVTFVSTCSNYGLIADGVLADEESNLSPLSLYAEAKVKAEELILQDLVKQANNIYTILRFATAFGLSARMRFDLTVNQFTRSLTLGDELVVFDADTWRPYCHVKDFARLIEIVQKSPEALVSGQVFNAGGDENNYTKRSLINEILKEIPNSKVIYQEDGNDPRNYRVNFSKVKSILRFTPDFTVQYGIKEIKNAIQNGFFLDDVEANNLYGNYHLE